MPRILFAAVLLAASVATAQMPVVSGEPSLTPKNSAASPKLRASDAPRFVRLAPVADSEMQDIRRANRIQQKRLLVGVVRAKPSATNLPSARDLAWKRVGAGYAAQVAVSSPQAGALRLAINLAGVPLDVEMVVFGSGAPQRLVGPIKVGDVADRTAPWWTPITDGETQTVEFFVPAGINAAALPLRVTAVSHVFTTIASGLSKRTSDIGDAGSCNIDVKCSTLQSSQAFLNARNSVAQMVITDASYTALCTGTLLNDTDAKTQTPWFYTANHCLENDAPPQKTSAQMQTVAASLNTLWFFEAAACHDTNVPAYVQLAGGATFIYNDATADVLLLRLNEPAPAGAFFAGWDANAIAPGTPVVAIHHPSGDLKKVSQGTAQAFRTVPMMAGSSGSFIEVTWSQGTTEGGSSGSGLWSVDGSQYKLRGGLWGGAASCQNLAGADEFSRFDQAYAALARYLSPPPSASPAANYTDMWWNPSESGWGLSIIQHPSGTAFVLWYAYEPDGTPAWYVMPSGTWSASNVLTGSLYSTSGPRANVAFNASNVRAIPVGSATIAFSGSNTANFSYSVNGVSGSKLLNRQSF